jgi:hypothetical protein
MTITADFFKKYKKAELVELLVNMVNGRSPSLDELVFESVVDKSSLQLTPEQVVALEKGEVVVLENDPLHTVQIIRNAN